MATLAEPGAGGRVHKGGLVQSDGEENIVLVQVRRQWLMRCSWPSILTAVRTPSPVERCNGSVDCFSRQLIAACMRHQAERVAAEEHRPLGQTECCISDPAYFCLSPELASHARRGRPCPLCSIWHGCLVQPSGTGVLPCALLAEGCCAQGDTCHGRQHVEGSTGPSAAL